MMSPMALDHPRLAEALKRARRARNWSQTHVAEVAEQLGYGQLLSRTTIQRYERATPFESIERVSTTLAAFERVYEWAPGACLAILNGGDPTPIDQTGDPAPRTEGAAVADALAHSLREGINALPVSVRHALSEGEVFDTDVIRVTVGGRTMNVVFVVKAEEYDTDEKRATVRKEAEAWMRMKQGIRDAVAEDTPDAPSDT